jgi:chromate transporter
MEVLAAFTRLGLTSFGGPVAHLGYFRTEFVERRAWLSDRAYAELAALAQFLPGPASSQVGMALGLSRAGFPGLVAAWVAFTLPSALLMIGFAYGFGALGTGGWLDGMKAAAVAVVAHAVLGMAQSLAPDRPRATIAVVGMVVALMLPTALGQVLVIVLGGLAGLALLAPAAGDGPEEDMLRVPVPRGVAAACLVAFFALLLLLPALAQGGSGLVTLIDGFYRAGALVFGGGHVALPLLQAEMVGTGRVPAEAFLAGYGAAQAVPGPLFSFAAFLGAASTEAPNGVAGGMIALVAIFLPSALLIVGALPFWARLRRSPRAQQALTGVNAAVVGLLAAVLYRPVFTEGVPSAEAMAIAALAFVALAVWRVPAWAVVLAAGLAGAAVL